MTTGQPVHTIASVASFFVSRVDGKADAMLPADSDLRGHIAVANARRAYARYLRRFADARWRPLRDAGANPQRPLWASTATKNAAYSDVLYVEELIAPDVINTMPQATLEAFADHGEIRRPREEDEIRAEEILSAAEAAGIDLRAITTRLADEGVRAFCDSYDELLSCIETRLSAAPPKPDGRVG